MQSSLRDRVRVDFFILETPSRHSLPHWHPTWLKITCKPCSSSSSICECVKIVNEMSAFANTLFCSGHPSVSTELASKPNASESNPSLSLPLLLSHFHSFEIFSSLDTHKLSQKYSPAERTKVQAPRECFSRNGHMQFTTRRERERVKSLSQIEKVKERERDECHAESLCVCVRESKREIERGIYV